MVFGTSVTVLLIASLSFFAMEWYAAKQGLIDRASLTSELMAEHLTAAVSFGDKATAERFLGSLSNDSDITFSAIITDDQQIFAAYPKANTSLHDDVQKFLTEYGGGHSEPDYHFTLSKLYLLQTISLNEQAVGILVMEVSLKGYWMHMALYLTLILALVIALIYLLQKVSTRFQRSIAKPIDLILQRMFRYKTIVITLSALTSTVQMSWGRSCINSTTWLLRLNCEIRNWLKKVKR